MTQTHAGEQLTPEFMPMSSLHLDCHMANVQFEAMPCQPHPLAPKRRIHEYITSWINHQSVMLVTYGAQKENEKHHDHL
jgi:hypothetical protein